MAQIVRAYMEETTYEVVNKIQEQIDKGYNVVSCSYTECPGMRYTSIALVIYEKVEEPSVDMSIGMDWSNSCIAKPWPHSSEPDIDIDVKSSLLETIKEYIKKKYRSGSTGIGE